MNKSNKTYSPDAYRYAVKATLGAHDGLSFQKAWQSIEKAFNIPLNVMHNILVIILLLCCACTIGADIAFSFDAYEIIALRNTDFAFLVFVIAGFIVFWGLAASHLLAPKISKKIRDFKVRQLIYLGEEPSVAEEQVVRETRQYFIYGLLAAVSVILFVLGLSHIRIEALESINNAQDFDLSLKGVLDTFSGQTEQQVNEYTWIDLWMPSILVLLEILTGIYLAYFIMRVSVSIKKRKYKAKYEHYKLVCHAETERAVACYHRALAENEKITLSKELKDALYRFEHRSLADDNYLEPITEENLKMFSKNGQQHKETKLRAFPNNDKLHI